MVPELTLGCVFKVNTYLWVKLRTVTCLHWDDELRGRGNDKVWITGTSVLHNKFQLRCDCSSSFTGAAERFKYSSLWISSSLLPSETFVLFVTAASKISCEITLTIQVLWQWFCLFQVLTQLWYNIIFQFINHKNSVAFWQWWYSIVGISK